MQQDLLDVEAKHLHLQATPITYRTSSLASRGLVPHTVDSQPTLAVQTVSRSSKSILTSTELVASQRARCCS